MAQYKPLKGETLYDVAVKLYNGDWPAGMADLFMLNPGVNVNGELFGLTLNYTENVRRKKPVFSETVPPVTKFTYKTIKLQTIYDLSVQLYGSLAFLDRILSVFKDMNTTIPIGSPIEVEITQNHVVKFFGSRRQMVATDLVSIVIDSKSYRLLEDGSYRLLETGDKRLIE